MFSDRRQRFKKRIFYLSLGIMSVALGVFLLSSTLKDSITFFYTPTEAQAYMHLENRKIRVGGLVEKGSVVKVSSDVFLFTLTDNQHSVSVEYQGLLPNLFREEQGIVAEGYFMPDKMFKAVSLLAKHDENYRPPSPKEKTL